MLTSRMFLQKTSYFINCSLGGVEVSTKKVEVRRFVALCRYELSNEQRRFFEEWGIRWIYEDDGEFIVCRFR